MKILIHTSLTWGGVVDYMIQQASEMERLGHEVTLIVPTNFDRPVSGKIEVLRLLPPLDSDKQSSKMMRRFQWVQRLLKGWKMTASEAGRRQPDALLLSGFAEYLSPLWKHHFDRLRRKLPGLKIGATVHDPIRHPLGPEFWHRRSMRCAFEMLDVAFYHGHVSMNPVSAAPSVPFVTVPHGAYPVPEPASGPREVRESLGVSSRSVFLLAFGHVRNYKNFDLAIEMLADYPGVHLVIAGTTTSSQDRPASYYQELAASRGVAEQLTILDRFIPDGEAADLFNTADLILLSYSREFVSASGVLHLAIQFRKPVLASSGGGHLKWAVEEYGLGVWVEPDSREALKQGLTKLLDESAHLTPRWEAYEAENTWTRNAEIVVNALSAGAPPTHD